MIHAQLKDHFKPMAKKFIGIKLIVKYRLQNEHGIHHIAYQKSLTFLEFITLSDFILPRLAFLGNDFFHVV